LKSEFYSVQIISVVIHGMFYFGLGFFCHNLNNVCGMDEHCSKVHIVSFIVPLLTHPQFESHDKNTQSWVAQISDVSLQ